MTVSSARAPIRLPDDLSRSLQHLDDAALRKLRDAVRDEIERRSQEAGSSKLDSPAALPNAAVQIPEGKANLIRASFKAGVAPAAIARTLGLSLALVRRVLQSNVSRPP